MLIRVLIFVAQICRSFWPRLYFSFSVEVITILKSCFKCVFEASPGSSFSIALTLRFRLIGLNEHTSSILRSNHILSPSSSPSPPSARESLPPSTPTAHSADSQQADPEGDTQRADEGAIKSRRRGELKSKEDNDMGRPRRGPPDQTVDVERTRDERSAPQKISRSRSLPRRKRESASARFRDAARSRARRSQHERRVVAEDEERVLLEVLGARANESVHVYERKRELRCIGTVRPAVFCLIAYFLGCLQYSYNYSRIRIRVYS